MSHCVKFQFSGYVLDDFPSVSEDFLSMDDQFEFLKKLPLKPDFIIKLRVRFCFCQLKAYLLCADDNYL